MDATPPVDTTPEPAPVAAAPAPPTQWLRGGLAAFPAVHGALVVFALLRFIWRPHFEETVVLFFFVYLLPILAYRVLGYFFPVKEKAVRASSTKHTTSWSAHKLQALFDAVPLFEAPLLLIPGAFSVWLRLWGSNVGRHVRWFPTVRVLDRAWLDIGDDVVIGHGVEFAPSATVSRKRGGIRVRRHIAIGQGSFVGAYSRLGPGTRLGKHVVLGASVSAPYDVRVGDGAHVPPGTIFGSRARVPSPASSAKPEN